jgi:hypothetical protein
MLGLCSDGRKLNSQFLVNVSVVNVRMCTGSNAKILGLKVLQLSVWAWTADIQWARVVLNWEYEVLMQQISICDGLASSVVWKRTEHSLSLGSLFSNLINMKRSGQPHIKSRLRITPISTQKIDAPKIVTVGAWGCPYRLFECSSWRYWRSSILSLKRALLPWISISGRSPHINSQYTRSTLMIYFITNRIIPIITYSLCSTQHKAWNTLTKLVDWLPEQLYHLEHLVVPVYTNTSRHRHYQGLQQSLAETEFWYEGRNRN